MHRFVLLLNLFLLSCTESKNLQFVIVNPDMTNQKPWIKHQGLPDFDAKIHSDGCSGGMSAIYGQLKFLHKKNGKTLAWRECCEAHDQAYYYGGNMQEKKAADSQLNACVKDVVGSKFLGETMQLAVKIGGGPHLPTPYRWGYGEDYR